LPSSPPNPPNPSCKADLSSHSASAETSQLSEEGGLSDIDAAPTTPNPSGGRKPPKLGQALQKRTSSTAAKASAAGNPQEQQLAAPPQQQYQQPEPQQDQLSPVINRGRRIVPVHQSRITDRPAKVGEKDSSLKIKIELDLEVEVELYARVKGDVMIGLM
jgi:hypothetical protein